MTAFLPLVLFRSIPHAVRRIDSKALLCSFSGSRRRQYLRLSLRLWTVQSPNMDPVLPQDIHHRINRSTSHSRRSMSVGQHAASSNNFLFPLHSKNVLPIVTNINQKNNSRYKNMMHNRPD